MPEAGRTQNLILFLFALKQVFNSKWEEYPFLWFENVRPQAHERKIACSV